MEEVSVPAAGVVDVALTNLLYQHGWGIADLSTSTSGYADVGSQTPVALTTEGMTVAADSASVTVATGSGLRVTQSYTPVDGFPTLYQCDITLENISNSPIDIKYRRTIGLSGTWFTETFTSPDLPPSNEIWAIS